MYRRPKFLEVLLEIRQEMARQADYDVDLFAEMVRAGKFPEHKAGYDLTAGEADGKTKNRIKKQTGAEKPDRNRQS